MSWWRIRNWFDKYFDYHAIKYGIKNLIKWFPLIWKDRDFDYRYLYDILYFKLGEMQKFFEFGNTYSVDAKQYAEQIKECRRLLKRIMDESTQDENFDFEKCKYIIPINEVYRLEKEEKKLFWNMMCDNVDDWWD